MFGCEMLGWLAYFDDFGGVDDRKKCFCSREILTSHHRERICEGPSNGESRQKLVVG